jgi:hypothetical protein
MPRKTQQYDLGMDAELFESLLYQTESEVLDFKVDQYPFEAANDIQKSELLKDILSFANSWRRSDAYILIGVEEVRGGRSNVKGISKQLLNRNLQQFVHSKTNKALSFSYEELQVEGHLVAAITIPMQERSFYIRKDFGKLRANAVYVRRGDTTGEAPPDEIMKMGQVGIAVEAQPTLDLGFANLEERRIIGKEIDIESIEFEMPEADSIPDYGQMRNRGLLAMPVDIGESKNADYLREIATYVADHGRFQPVGFAVENSSTAPAFNVVLRMRIQGGQVEVRDEDDMPNEPARSWLTRVGPLPARWRQTDVRVSHRGDFFEVRIGLGTIQPGISEFSAAPIFIGSPESYDINVDAILSGDNVKIPVVQKMHFKAQVEKRKFSVKDLKQLAL